MHARVSEKLRTKAVRSVAEVSLKPTLVDLGFLEGVRRGRGEERN